MAELLDYESQLVKSSPKKPTTTFIRQAYNRPSLEYITQRPAHRRDSQATPIQLPARGHEVLLDTEMSEAEPY